MKHGVRTCVVVALGLLLAVAGCAIKKEEEPPATTVAAPVFSPQAATYSAEIDVAISTSTAAATIRYTTDGSAPTETAGTVYAGPVHVAADLTLKAVAYRTGWTTSAVTSGDYVIAPLVAAPVFSPPAGEYLTAQDVVLATATDGASIRYTTDGSTPTAANGTLNAGPVHVASSLVLKAAAFRDGWTASPVTSGEYLIGPLAEAPAFAPPPGEYEAAQDVAMSTATAGASIRYTTDGSTPTETAGTLYAGPVHLAASATLKAVAFGTGLRTSAVAAGAYTIGFFVLAPEFTPGPGTYQEPQDVAIATATAGATIRYTLDGSTPTETAGTLYTGAVRLAESATLKAVAYRAGWTTSPVATGQYEIGPAVAAPQFGVPPGFIGSAVEVAVTTTTAGASIRYTTDGSTPSATAGTLYAAPVRIDRSLTLRAVAYRTGLGTSAVTAGEYKRVGVAGGRFHSVLAGSDGGVWTWGGNYEGQLGDGGTSPRRTPALVTGISGVVAAAAGHYHTVALKGDGTVWAWGRNLYGQLGDASNSQRLAPGAAVGIGDVIAVAAGENHTYALKGDGTVWAWGSNSDGQIGDGTTTDRYFAVQVQGLVGVTAIAAGDRHGAALKSDGTVWTWGHNGFGQLGDGSTTTRLVAAQVPGLTRVTGLAAGGFHTVAVKDDGTIWSWGSGSYGELGNGTQAMTTPAPVQALGLTTAAAVAAGSYHTVAVLDDGTARAFGLNYFGQLGDGTNINRSAAVVVAALPAGIVAVAASLDHTLAVLNDGSVWAWGHNLDFQLGDNTNTDRWSPVRVKDGA